jgi:hypothetical protein
MPEYFHNLFTEYVITTPFKLTYNGTYQNILYRLRNIQIDTVYTRKII